MIEKQFYSVNSHADNWIVMDNNVKSSNIVNWHRLIVQINENQLIDDYRILSIKIQNKMNLKIAKYLSNNDFDRKMIGYFYAIQHGAKWIYETKSYSNIGIFIFK
jgi:hypothetical protein